MEGGTVIGRLLTTLPPSTYLCSTLQGKGVIMERDCQLFEIISGLSREAQLIHFEQLTQSGARGCQHDDRGGGRKHFPGSREPAPTPPNRPFTQRLNHPILQVRPRPLRNEQLFERLAHGARVGQGGGTLGATRRMLLDTFAL